MNRNTKATTSRRADPSGNGQGAASPFRLEPFRRRVQVPQLLIAVFLVAVSALVAVVLFSRAAARDPVLALANPVERGQAIVSGDLMVAYVATDDPVATVSAEAAAGLVGLMAVADLEAGTIISPALFVSHSLLNPGEAVVGLALSPGEYPTPLLAPGDRVDVVSTGPVTAEPGASKATTLVTSAEVFDVAELGTQGDRFISLQVPDAVAAEVAAAAAADRVRLVLVAGVER